MKIAIWSFLPLLTILSCSKSNEVPLPEEIETWNATLPEITERIFDSRVNGEELHIITNNFFYRIHGENLLEKRPLTQDRYHSYSNPILGQHLIFRLINFDTVAFLEFQPIRQGGNVERLSYDELGADKQTFPITHGFGGKHTGRFDDQNHFVFVGFDYPSLQQFVSRLSVDYDSTSNTIHEITVIERLNLYPDIYIEQPSRVEDVFVADGIIFINAGHGGIYRYSQNSLDYYPDIRLSSVVKDSTNYYGSNSSRDIITSADFGMSWVTTSLTLHEGSVLLKEGDFYITTSEYNQVFRVGKSINELKPFSFPPFSDISFKYAMIKYYNGSYFLFGNIDGIPKIYKRSSLI